MNSFVKIALLTFFTLLAGSIVSAIPNTNRQVSVYMSDDAGSRLQKCVKEAVKLLNGTCLRITLVNNTAQADVQFEETSQYGICGLDPKDSKIVLNKNCIGGIPLNWQICYQLLGRALTGNRNKFLNVAPDIHAHYKCEDTCHLVCENGDLKPVFDELDECSCVCPQRGLFTGRTCSELVKLTDYTDSSCGIIQVNNSNPEGTIKLHSPMDGNTYCQWLLKSDNAWDMLELNITEMEMSQRFAGTANCPDTMQIFDGGNPMTERVNCQNNIPPEGLFISSGPSILIQLEGYRYDPTPRAGPTIHYKIRPPQFTDEITSLTFKIVSGNADVRSWTIPASEGVAGFFGVTPSLVALLVVSVGVALIALILLGIRRHSANQLKRGTANGGGEHQPVPTSPTPPAATV